MMKTTKYKPAEPEISLKPTILDSIFFVYTAFDVYDNVILSVRHYKTGNSFITIKFQHFTFLKQHIVWRYNRDIPR